MAKLFQGVGNFVSYTFNSLDQTSAANDVIVIRHRDGSLHSSPFNVRFGKAKVIRPTDKVVSISTNGEPTTTHMKMGEDGVAFWLVPTTGDVPEELLSSPLQTPRSDGSGSEQQSPTMVLDGPASEPSSPGPKLPPSSSHVDPSEGLTKDVEKVVVDETDGKVVEVREAASPLPSEAGHKYDQLLVSLKAETVVDAHDTVADGDGSSHGDTTVPEPVLVEEDASDASGAPSNATPIPTPQNAGGLRLSIYASCDDVAALHHRVATDEGDLQLLDMNAAMDAEDVDTDGSLFSSDDEFEYYEDRLEEEVPMDGEKAAHYRRSFQPTTADLHKLNLKTGANTVTFTTNSRLRGSVSVDACIYLWDSDTKIVVSDIDGTITKSDVLGQILPKIGRDWTHPGICDLYNQIARNGYQFLYVTARSVSQIYSTKNFVFSVEQNGQKLPKGPCMTAPDRLWDALTQEVGKRSHEFKIACLKAVAAAFPKHGQPFYAGFGNRLGDAIAYTATNIPKTKIFIIDATSAVHVASVRQSYTNLAEMVDCTFPPVDLVVRGSRQVTQEEGTGMAEGEHMDQQFNSHNYWRVDPSSYFSPPKPQTPPTNKSADSLSATQTPGATASAGSTGDANSVHSAGSGSPNTSANGSPVLGPAQPGAEGADGEKKGGWSFWGRRST